MPAFYPDIRFNSSTGSDTAASGAGPSTAITATAAAHTSGIASTTITLTNSPDLSGVATDGSAALWLNTASGRQWSRITAVNNTLKTVTVEDSFNIAALSAVNYAIGGKRATFNETNSRKLFSDAKAYWIATTETDQTISSVISVTSAGSPFFVRGDSETSHRVVTQSANAACFNSGVANLNLMNLKFQNTNVSKGSAGGYSGSGGNGVRMTNCIVGDATNTLSFAASSLVSLLSVFTRCYFLTTGSAINTTGTGATLHFESCFFDMPAGVTAVNYGSTASVILKRSIFKGGANAIATGGGILDVENCVFRGQSTAALSASAVLTLGKIENCIFDSCGVPMNFASTQPGFGVLVSRNDIFNCSANANAPTDNYPLTIDPAFVNVGTNNFTVGASSLKAAAFPYNIQNLGVSSGTPGYFDLGATQSQSAGGGGGLILARAMNGGYSA